MLGIPIITQITDMMHLLVLLIATVKYAGIGIAFLIQQLERSRHGKYVRS
jgi:hypothetical protein